MAREVVAPNSDGLVRDRAAWPQAVRGGVLDRAGARATSSSPIPRRASGSTRCCIRTFAASPWSEKRVRQPGQLVVHVVPLLFETGYDRLVDNPSSWWRRSSSASRALSRRDSSTKRRSAREWRHRCEPEEARRNADFMIENDGNLEHLRERVARGLRGAPLQVAGRAGLAKSHGARDNSQRNPEFTERLYGNRVPGTFDRREDKSTWHKSPDNPEA